MTTDIDPLIRSIIMPANVESSAGSLGSTIIWQIVLQIALIALNAIFACAEIAVISTNDNKLSKLASEGDKRAKRLVSLTSQPARFLATIQVAITLAGFLGSAFAAENFAVYIQRLVPGIPNSLCVIIITILLSYLTLIFGELVPKRVAMKKAESLALGMSSLLYFVSKLFFPLVWLLTASTNGVLRLLKIDPAQDDNSVTEEEIRMMVDVGSENGTIDSSEKEMIQNVFEFDDLSAEKIATHRTDIVILSMDESIEEWDEVIHENRHSHYPLCGDSVDDIIGILNAKDYFRIRGKSRESIMARAVRPAYFIPEGVKADVLFRNMKRDGRRFAVVLDEYGGVSGIITMNDLIEQLVGKFDDEEDAPENENEIIKLPDGTWQLKGSALLDDVINELKVKLPSDEYDTFGGYVFSTFGSIVDDGTTFELESDGLSIKVLEVHDHRIEKALVSKLPTPEQSQGND